MPFCSESYYRNLWRRRALEELTQAREYRAEAIREAAEELPSLSAVALGADYMERRIASAVRSARCSWRLYLSQRRICQLSNESRASWRKPKPAYKPAPFSTRLTAKESSNGDS